MSQKVICYLEGNIQTKKGHVWVILYIKLPDKELMDNTNNDNMIKGTTKWYFIESKKTAVVSGKFAVRQSVAQHLPFKNGEELLIEFDKAKGTVCIKKL